MNDELDRMLAGLATVPTPGRLANMDGLVLSRLSIEAVEARAGARIGAGAAVGALVMGLIFSSALSAPSPAAPLSAFGSSAALAPSTLLEGGR
jgi:hypothetical protein